MVTGIPRLLVRTVGSSNDEKPGGIQNHAVHLTTRAAMLPYGHLEGSSGRLSAPGTGLCARRQYRIWFLKGDGL